MGAEASNECLSTEEGDAGRLAGPNVLYNVLAIKCNDPHWHDNYKSAFFDPFAMCVIFIIAYFVFISKKMLRPAFIESEVRWAKLFCVEIDRKALQMERYAGESANLLIQSLCMVISFSVYMAEYSDMSLDNSRSMGSCGFCVYLAVGAFKPFFASSLSFLMSSARSLLLREENKIKDSGISCVELPIVLGYLVIIAVYVPAGCYTLLALPFILQWIAVCTVLSVALMVAGVVGAGFAMASSWPVGIACAVTKQLYSNLPAYTFLNLLGNAMGLYFTLYLIHDCGWNYLTVQFFDGFIYLAQSGFNWPGGISAVQQVLLAISLSPSAAYIFYYLFGAVALTLLPASPSLSARYGAAATAEEREPIANNY